MQINEKEREIQRKTKTIEELRNKEQKLLAKLEELEIHSKQEIKTLLEKIENDKINWY